MITLCYLFTTLYFWGVFFWWHAIIRTFSCDKCCNQESSFDDTCSQGVFFQWHTFIMGLHYVISTITHLCWCQNRELYQQISIQHNTHFEFNVHGYFDCICPSRSTSPLFHVHPCRYYKVQISISRDSSPQADPFDLERRTCCVMMSKWWCHPH